MLEPPKVSQNGSKSEESILRAQDASRIASYGISYLDDGLNGLRPSDMAIIASKTGSGKTELATFIASQNAIAGRRVALIALEAERFEIERRLKYQLIAKLFFEDPSRFSGIKLNFADWMFCKYEDKLDWLEHEADLLMTAYSPNLSIITPQITNFTKDDFSVVYETLAEQSDLILLDHIHYIAHDDREQETDHIKKTMWKLKEAIFKHRVPIIAFSHIRKESNFEKVLVPQLEQLHGSSEITKQANHVISIAPAFEVPSKATEQPITPPVGSTFCQILKARIGQDRCTSYIGLLRFDFKTRLYDKSYIPYETNRKADKLKPMKYQDFEYWMGNAREAAL